MIVFGGYYFDGDHHRVNTSHALDLVGPPTWTQLATGGALPTAVDAHTAVFDEPRDRMIVFGGHTQNGGQTSEAWTLTFIHTVGVQEVAARRVAVEVRAYPVPARSGVTFEIRSPRAGGATVVVSDLAGRVVRRLAATEREVTRIRWDGRTAAGTPTAAGVYFYRVQCAAGQASGRLIKID